MLRSGAVSERRQWRIGYVLAAATAAVVFGLISTTAIVAASGTVGQAPAAAAEGAAADGRAADDANIIAAWSRVRVGWIYVYGDGRVVLRHDNGRLLTSEGSVSFGVIQRRLSPFGLQLVRTGTVNFAAVLGQPDDVESGFWSPAAPALYQPSSYALCLVNTAPNPPRDQLLLDMPEIIDRVGGPAAEVLRDGVVRSFTDDFLDEHGDFAGMDGFHSAPGRGVECIVLDKAGMLALWAQTRLPLSGPDDRGVLRLSDATFGVLTDIDGAAEYLVAAIPILPHGGWVVWAG